MPGLVLMAMLATAFLLGGGSRYDIVTLPILRFIAVCGIGFGLYRMDRELFRRAVPLWLPFAFFTAWMAMQLVPLPPALWTSLPGRDLIAEIDAVVGIADQWRAISLVPWRTTNALLALVVPWSILLLCAGRDAVHPVRLAQFLVAVGLLSALFGLLQFAGSQDSILYLYRITNEGSSVGLFANRNHNAVFLACCLPLLGLAVHASITGPATTTRSPVKRTQTVTLTIAAAVGGFIVLAILATGSRAGFLAMAVGACIALALISMGLARAAPAKPSGRIGVSIALLLVLGLVAMLLSGRIEAIERLAEIEQSDELRFKIWGPIASLIGQFGWPGTGFGTLPDVYQIVEPQELLGPLLVNHAHNDWLEVLVEGGLPAAAAAAAGAIALAVSGVRRWKNDSRSAGTRAELLAYGSVVAILALFSLADYPLRTPSLAALFALAVMVIATGGRANKLLANQQTGGGASDRALREGLGS